MKYLKATSCLLLVLLNSNLFAVTSSSSKTSMATKAKSYKVPYAGLLQLNSRINESKSLAPTHTGIWSSATSEGYTVGSYDQDWVTAYSLDEKKFVWWYASSGSSLSTRPTVSGDKVLLSFRSGLTVQLSTSTGQKDWEVHVPTYADRPVVVLDDLVIVQTVDQKVFAFDKDTAKTKWLFESPVKPSLGLSGGAVPISIGEYILVGDDSGYLYSVHKSDGAPVWRFNPQTSDERFQSVVNGFAYLGQNLVAARSDGFVGSFIPEGGEATKRVWQLKGVKQVSRALYEDQHYYIGSLTGVVKVVDVSTGETAWQTKLIHPVADLFKTENSLYAISSSCHLTSLSLVDGSTKWSVGLNGFCHGNLFVHSGKLHVPTGYNRFYLYEDR